MRKTPELKGKGAFVRMCASCGKRQHRDMMLCISVGPEGAILGRQAVQAKGVSRGKCSYICKNTVCVSRAAKTHRPEKLIGCAPNNLLYEIIKEQIEL